MENREQEPENRFRLEFYRFITTEGRSLVAVCTYDVQHISDISCHLQKYMRSHGHAKSISSMTTKNYVTSIGDSGSCDVQAQFLFVKF